MWYNLDMPTIEQLGIGVGDRVRYRAAKHLTLAEYLAFQGEIPVVEHEAEIVDLDERAVYLHPWTEDLAAFTRIQNTKTRGIYPVRAYHTGDGFMVAPLEEGERLILAMDRHGDMFSAVNPTELAPPMV